MKNEWKGKRKSLWQNVLVGFASAVFFSFLYLAGVLTPLEDRLYDAFLRFRAKRARISNVVLLDVDDASIAHNGVFPWPRSIMADGLLRLKEYGAKAAIFDIEYIDKGPQGVDSIYLNQGLPDDFNRSFNEIASAASDVFSALKAGRISRGDIDEYSAELSSFINDERENLIGQAQGVARDNDLYLAQASALFGRSWATLNLRDDPLLGEQAERLPIAEERFSREITAAHTASRGANFADILPPIPSFAHAAKGAGFTNVEIDSDGTRRRIYLAQNIKDHWYYQLAFAPLMDFLGNPEIELDRDKMIIKNARLPSGEKNIHIPLDGEGRMMLDWPPEDYEHSYAPHISFAEFSLLEDNETNMEQYGRALLTADIPFFSQFDNSIAEAPFIAGDLVELSGAALSSKALALENCSDEHFSAYVDYRAQSRAFVKQLVDLDIGTKVKKIASDLEREQFPSIDAIRDEAEYIAMLAEYLAVAFSDYTQLENLIAPRVRDSFCVLGRVDTGTTDLGVNPFHSRYVNVGTHAVVLDTILSESFILPLSIWWRVLFMLAAVPLIFLFTAVLTPVARVAVTSSGALLILAASVLIFRFTGIFFGPLGIILAIVSAAVVREIISYAKSDREKRFYRKAFATYTSEAVADEIARNPGLLQLGGTKRRMSAIFTDIQGFSTISEQLSPEDLVSLLNRYLTVMSDVILEEQGTIDKYEGDAIIAFFGAPLEQEDNALRACMSAVKMKRAEAGLNRLIAEQRLCTVPLITRVGINSGDMVAGNMGTDKKMNYTIMGDAVNLAARLEGVNKQYGTWILASGETVRQTGDNLLIRRLDRVRVVGKSEPVQLCNIVNIRADANDDQKKLVNVFHEALDYFEKRNWTQAAQGFREAASLEETGPSSLYLKRCNNYLEKPPEDSWDGIFNLTEK